MKEKVHINIIPKRLVSRPTTIFFTNKHYNFENIKYIEFKFGTRIFTLIKLSLIHKSKMKRLGDKIIRIQNCLVSKLILKVLDNYHEINILVFC